MIIWSEMKRHSFISKTVKSRPVQKWLGMRLYSNSAYLLLFCPGKRNYPASLFSATFQALQYSAVSQSVQYTVF